MTLHIQIHCVHVYIAKIVFKIEIGKIYIIYVRTHSAAIFAVEKFLPLAASYILKGVALGCVTW